MQIVTNFEGFKKLVEFYHDCKFIHMAKFEKFGEFLCKFFSQILRVLRKKLVEFFTNLLQNVDYKVFYSHAEGESPKIIVPYLFIYLFIYHLFLLLLISHKQQQHAFLTSHKTTLIQV